jgi:hypothetical protein
VHEIEAEFPFPLAARLGGPLELERPPKNARFEVMWLPFFP